MEKLHSKGHNCNTDITRHFVEDITGKLRGTGRKGLNSPVHGPVNLSAAGQYKICVQYDFKFTPVYSDRQSMDTYFSYNFLENNFLFVY